MAGNRSARWMPYVGARLFHAQDGDPHITIIAQRLFNQRLQLRIAEEGTPAGQRGWYRCRGGGVILCRHRQRRPHIVRRHRTATGHQHGDDRQRQCCCTK